MLRYVRPALLVLGFLISIVVTGCGGSDDGEEPIVMEPEPTFSVASGTFDVTAQVIFDTCETDSIFDGAFDLQFDGNTFTMGGRWDGAWNASTATGNGESEHVSVVIRFCTVTTWTSVTFTFESEDEFTGSITFRQRVNGDCREPCITTWTITGVRQAPPPAIP